MQINHAHNAINILSLISYDQQFKPLIRTSSNRIQSRVKPLNLIKCLEQSVRRFDTVLLEASATLPRRCQTTVALCLQLNNLRSFHSGLFRSLFLGYCGKTTLKFVGRLSVKYNRKVGWDRQLCAFACPLDVVLLASIVGNKCEIWHLNPL